jgi:hypothetical protein
MYSASYAYGYSIALLKQIIYWFYNGIDYEEWGSEIQKKYLDRFIDKL